MQQGLLDMVSSRRKILFVHLGTFSHTNESIYFQLVKRFPNHEIIDFCAKEAILKRKQIVLKGLLNEAVHHGPLILLDRIRRHEFFFKQSYTFSRLSSIIRETFLPFEHEIDAVVQTQGLFNGGLPNVPLILYIDYTLKSPQFGTPKIFPDLIELETNLYREANAIAASASHLKTTLTSKYGCDEKKIYTIYIGANIKPQNIVKNISRYARRQICFVGIEWERKGGPVLLEAFRKIADRFPDSRLVIAGCSPRISDPRVQTFGRISREEIAVIYRESSLFCLPSIIEPSSVAVIEAAAYGLPVVGSEVGGFFDSVENGKTGFLVPPNDVNSLALALSKLLSNPEMAQEMGFAGSSRISERFNWDIVGEKLAAIIEKTANL